MIDLRSSSNSAAAAAASSNDDDDDDVKSSVDADIEEMKRDVLKVLVHSSIGDRPRLADDGAEESERRATSSLAALVDGSVDAASRVRGLREAQAQFDELKGVAHREIDLFLRGVR